MDTKLKGVWGKIKDFFKNMSTKVRIILAAALAAVIILAVALIVWSGNQPYTTLHNEGGKGSVTVRQHTRKSKKGKNYTVKQHTRAVKVPQRQFVGDGKETRQIIENVINHLIMLISEYFPVLWNPIAS